MRAADHALVVEAGVDDVQQEARGAKVLDERAEPDQGCHARLRLNRLICIRKKHERRTASQPILPGTSGVVESQKKPRRSGLREAVGPPAYRKRLARALAIVPPDARALVADQQRVRGPPGSRRHPALRTGPGRRAAVVARATVARCRAAKARDIAVAHGVVAHIDTGNAQHLILRQRVPSEAGPGRRDEHYETCDQAE